VFFAKWRPFFLLKSTVAAAADKFASINELTKICMGIEVVVCTCQMMRKILHNSIKCV